MAVQIKGLDVFTAQMKRVASMIPQGDISDILVSGGNVIVEEAKDNVLRQGLVDTGALYDSIIAVPVGRTKVDILVNVPYGAVHEYGLPKGGKGMFSATAKQIRFFWAKYMETGNEMWKALALKKGYTIPPRPYVTPAIMSKQAEVTKQMVIDLEIALSNKLMGV
jgi:phage gpG-like protein